MTGIDWKSLVLVTYHNKGKSMCLVITEFRKGCRWAYAPDFSSHSHVICEATVSYTRKGIQPVLAQTLKLFEDATRAVTYTMYEKDEDGYFRNSI